MKFLSRLMVVGLSAVLLGGCAHIGKPKTEGSPDLAAAQNGENGASQPEVKLSGSEEASTQVMANISKPYQSPLGEVPLDETPLTQKWVEYFQGKGRKHMEVYLARSTRYLPMMKNTLREYGLPEDLVYIALIESGFSPMAHSRANAVGYWQFIRGTGRRYGLMLDPFIDERRDPVLSTRAAAEYFKALYNLFGSWHLALASYNVGENRVKRAVMNHYTRDYWELIKKRKALPKETKHYVAKFIAAALIARDPKKYGFDEIEYQEPLAFETVGLANPISMTKLAEAMKVDVEDLKALNPKFRGDFIPQYRGPETVIRVPVGTTQVAVAAIPMAISEQPKVVVGDYYYYRVKHGDSLSTIARKHRTSIAQIRRLNGLGARTFLRLGQRLKVPDRGGAFVTYEMPQSEGAQTEPGEKQQGEREVSSENETHVVRRGENLSTIARKYGVSVDQLRKLNKLNNRATLRAGQTLKLKDQDETLARPNSALDSRRVKPKMASDARHSRASSTLSARRADAKVPDARRAAAKVADSRKAAETKTADSRMAADPKSADSRRSEARAADSRRADAKSGEEASTGTRNSRMLAAIREIDQDLQIDRIKKKRKKHKVRRGETLAEIAQLYNVSVGAIAQKNMLKNRSQLLAGRELIIPAQ